MCIRDRYRLEMQARLAAGGAGDLYGYWKDAIYRELYRPDGESGRRCKVLNLASKEYSKACLLYTSRCV